jgi:hypothetical protein
MTHKRYCLVWVLLIGLSIPFASHGQGPPPSSPSSGKNSSEELWAATLSVENPGILLGTRSSRVSQQELEEAGKTQGFQFKDPVFSHGFTYRNDHDSSSPAGFHDDEYSADLGLDADIYDGWIAGALYSHMTREGHNSLRTRESLNANGFSIYAAKRFFELLNVGAAYNFMANEHRLRGTTAANLDSTSNGFTTFVGVSDKIDEWYLASTVSYVFAADDYDAQANLDTAMLSVSGQVDYDVNDWFSPGIYVSYNHYLQQDRFAGTSVDDDYWAIGPRFQFFPTDDVTVHVDLETWEGYTGYSSYKIRIGLDYAF